LAQGREELRSGRGADRHGGAGGADGSPFALKNGTDYALSDEVANEAVFALGGPGRVRSRHTSWRPLVGARWVLGG